MSADVALPANLRPTLYKHLIRRYPTVQLRQIIECHLRILGCKVVHSFFQYPSCAVRAPSLSNLSLDRLGLPFPAAFPAFPPNALRAACYDIRWSQVAVPSVIPFFRNIGIACSQVRPTGNDHLSKTCGTSLVLSFLLELSCPTIPANRATPCILLTCAQLQTVRFAVLLRIPSRSQFLVQLDRILVPLKWKIEPPKRLNLCFGQLSPLKVPFQTGCQVFHVASCDRFLFLAPDNRHSMPCISSSYS